MFNRCMKLLQENSKKIIIGSSITLPCIGLTTVIAGDIDQAHIPHYHWEFEKWNKSYDVAALRRGYQVYKEVCSSCHGMRFLCYRHLVGIVFTEKQAKREAKNALIEDGPDENGEMFLREGVLTDSLPAPYKNDNAARAANNGALPPDLSLIAGARVGGPNYLFSLLTGYSDEVPPGATLEPGQYFNPFMAGGSISMPPPLQDGAVEYPDGTPATVTQMAADITEFLQWAYWRNMDVSKRTGMAWIIFGITSMIPLYYCRRYLFLGYLTQKLKYKNKPYGFK